MALIRYQLAAVADRLKVSDRNLFWVLTWQGASWGCAEIAKTSDRALSYALAPLAVSSLSLK